MRFEDIIRYYLHFRKGPKPAAIPECRVRYLCITHPFATNDLFSYPIRSSVRLACLSHAASVRSEPGSNSSIVYRLPKSHLRGIPVACDSLAQHSRLRTRMLIVGWDRHLHTYRPVAGLQVLNNRAVSQQPGCFTFSLYLNCSLVKEQLLPKRQKNQKNPSGLS